VLYCRFDGDRQYNFSNNQQYGHVLGPPRDFADSDVDLDSPGTLTLL